MSAQPETIRRLTVADIARLHADGERLAMLTAYDYPTAKLLDEAGIPLLLVGDSLGRAMLGYENEIPVSMADMLHHTAAVTRGAKRALVIGDLPFLTLSDGRAGGRQLRALPVRGRRPGGQARGRRPQRADHRGRGQGRASRSWATSAGRPQAANAAGKVRVLGKDKTQARALLADAFAVQEAGAFAVVLELVPEQLAAAITERLRIPTIGIGAGAGCSGQVQVITDLLGWDAWHPRHAKPYADLRGTILGAAAAYAADVAAGTFPGAEQTVRMDDAVLDEVLGRTDHDRAGRRHPGGRDPARPRPLSATRRPHPRGAAGRARRRPPTDRARPDDGLAARGPCGADPARARRRTRPSSSRSSSTRASSTRRPTTRSTRATRPATSRCAGERRGRPHLGAAGRGGLPARLRHDRLGRGGRPAARGRGATRALRRRGHGRGHPVQPRRGGARVLRPEGRPAGHGHPPDGPRPGHRHGPSSPVRRSASRTGWRCRRATSTSRRRERAAAPVLQRALARGAQRRSTPASAPADGAARADAATSSPSEPLADGRTTSRSRMD